MVQPRVTCGRCRDILPAEVCNTSGLTHCPTCAAALRALVFPALFRPLGAGHFGDRLLVDGEASCFYHSQKKATVPCDRCGRFLCALCDVELSGEHICPVCLQIGTEKGRLQALESKRVLYDDIACSLAVWPLLPFFWFLLPLTAPMALFFAIRHWKTPTSIVPRSKARFILAIVLSGLQIVGMAAAVALMVAASRGRYSVHG